MRSRQHPIATLLLSGRPVNVDCQYRVVLWLATACTPRQWHSIQNCLSPLYRCPKPLLVKSKASVFVLVLVFASKPSNLASMMSLHKALLFVLISCSAYAAPGHRELNDEEVRSLRRTANVEVTTVVVETLMQSSWPSSQPNEYDHFRDLRRQVTTTASIKCKKAGGPCTKVACCSTLTCDPLASTCAKPPKTTESKSTKSTKTSTKSKKTDTTTTGSEPTTTLATAAIVNTTPIASPTPSVCVNPPEGLQCFRQGCCPGYTCVADYSALSTAGYCSPTDLGTSTTQSAAASTSATTMSAIITTTTQAITTSTAATCNTDPAVDCYSRGCCAGYSCVANYYASSTAGSCSLTSFPSSTTTYTAISTTLSTTFATSATTASVCVNPPEGLQCFRSGCCSGYTCVADYSSPTTAGYCSPIVAATSSTTPSSAASTPLPGHSTTVGGPSSTTSSPASLSSSGAADITTSTTRPAKQTTTSRAPATTSSPAH